MTSANFDPNNCEMHNYKVTITGTIDDWYHVVAPSKQIALAMTDNSTYPWAHSTGDVKDCGIAYVIKDGKKYHLDIYGGLVEVIDYTKGVGNAKIYDGVQG